MLIETRIKLDRGRNSRFDVDPDPEKTGGPNYRDVHRSGSGSHHTEEKITFQGG